MKKKELNEIRVSLKNTLKKIMEETKSDFSKDNGIVQKMDALHNNLMKKCGNDSTIVFKLVTFVTKELLYENGTYDENDPFIQLINSL